MRKTIAISIFFVTSQVLVAVIAVKVFSHYESSRRQSLLTSSWAPPSDEEQVEVIGSGDRFLIVRTNVAGSGHTSYYIWDSINEKTLVQMDESKNSRGLQGLDLFRPDRNWSKVAGISVDASSGRVTQVMCSPGVDLNGTSNSTEVMYATNGNMRFDRRLIVDNADQSLMLRTANGWHKGKKSVNDYYLELNDSWHRATLSENGFWAPLKVE